MQKFTEPRADAFENIRESVDTNLNLSSVGKEHEVSNAGAEVTEWDSFVDWKIMEHQDYETIPDDQFQVLSKKLHIKIAEYINNSINYVFNRQFNLNFEMYP